MIKKARNYKTFNHTIEYEDGETWDFIGYHNNVAFNEIIAKGINFRKSIIQQNEDDWLCHILYAEVIEQDENQTIMHTSFLTNYRTDDIHQFELDSDAYYIIKHNKSLSQIKKDYKKENNLLKELQFILEKKGYTQQKYKCQRCSYCCDCLNKTDRKYEEITMKIDFTDNQTIGEVKNISDNDYNEVKEFIKKFYKAEVSRSLCFTEQGAVNELEIKHYFK